jgi:hypothetical protein
MSAGKDGCVRVTVDDEAPEESEKRVVEEDASEGTVPSSVDEVKAINDVHREEGEQDRDITEFMWDLDTDTKIKNLTWWWWWWIFFIRNPEDPARPRQLMILWSTKNCDRIIVNDYLWERNQDIVKTGEPGKGPEEGYRKRKMTFDGMTAVWWFDGKRMHDPFALERSDFTVEWKGAKGYVRPHTDNTFLFSGGPDEYKVRIRKGDHDFDLRMTPWNDFISSHRYKVGKYIGKMGYSNYKIYGSVLKGHVRSGDIDEDIEGTAYFQKVMVNAPAVPWFWGIFHTENGSLLEYFNPHFGFPVWHKDSRPTSFWQRGYFNLSKSLQFYDAETDAHYQFKKRQVKVKWVIEEDLPTFWVEGDNGEQRLSMKVRGFSRAYWRFEQKYWGFMRSVLHYNEYPTELVEFVLVGGKRDISRKDLGYTVGNIEHAWGWLV